MQDLPSRTEVIQQIKNNGGRIAAVMPIFYPRELLRTYGFQPIEIWGPPKVKACGHEHFQSSVCPIVRMLHRFF